MPVAVASVAVPPAAARVVAGVVLGLDGDGGPGGEVKPLPALKCVNIFQRDTGNVIRINRVQRNLGNICVLCFLRLWLLLNSLLPRIDSR